MVRGVRISERCTDLYPLVPTMQQVLGARRTYEGRVGRSVPTPYAPLSKGCQLVPWRSDCSVVTGSSLRSSTTTYGYWWTDEISRWNFVGVIVASRSGPTAWTKK